MGFPDRYDHRETESRLQELWAREQTYAYNPHDTRPLFVVDTPPPTVSGEIHIGHVYSYVQAEAIIRFQRMQGQNVYYPFGFDDNGLPTERYVERTRTLRAREIGREAFIAACLDASREVEDRFEHFWQGLGMSVDWRLRYSTIDPQARQISQWSFLDLFHKGRIYRAQAPNPWCVECQTAIAQAELDDAERQTTFYTLAFPIATDQTDHEPGLTIQIATTRPELLPACVAIFVHPEDARYAAFIGRSAQVPLIGRQVPILANPDADPAKGTGAVMCCTFGDSADVTWWREYQLPLIALITRDGRLSTDAGAYAGLRLPEARQRILADLAISGALIEDRPSTQTVRIHERCKTPIEILETKQWFIRVLDLKQELLAAGRQIHWYPEYMRTRYEHWVENLGWDWCISRQRFYGVPFPVWHCQSCGGVVLAEEAQLPIDPLLGSPPAACVCGSTDLRADTDVMDTWATSSVSPLIAALRWGSDTRPIAERVADSRLLPMQLRPQAHDIIRTWAFATIVKHLLHFGQIPWETIMISGHALARDGSSIHKSLGNSPIAPATLIERYGADAVRYWACSGSLSADQPVNEEEMRQGVRLCAKLWSAARFLAGFEYMGDSDTIELLPSDTALRSWTQRMVMRATEQYRRYEYAAARATAERFFWDVLCDYALEWSKSRLYDGTAAQRAAALYVLREAMLATIQVLAPIMPHITEEIYQRLFSQAGKSLHTSMWPALEPTRVIPEAEQIGEALMAIGAAVRRFKTAHRLGIGTRLTSLIFHAETEALQEMLPRILPDIQSLTRAADVRFAALGEGESDMILLGLRLAIER